LSLGLVAVLEGSDLATSRTRPDLVACTLRLDSHPPAIGLHTHSGPDALYMPSCKGFSFFLSMEQGLQGSGGRDANVLLSGGTANSCNSGAHRDSRGAGPMCVGGYPLLCGGMRVRRGCGRVCSGASYCPW
jgi:hypothetical protein